MSEFYCLSPRVFRGDKRERDQTDCPDLYAPGTPDYRQRNCKSEVVVGSGLLRIDLGDPLPRLSCEPQPVTCEPPEEPIQALPELSVQQTPIDPAPRPEPHWRSSYGLSKV